MHVTLDIYFLLNLN